MAIEHENILKVLDIHYSQFSKDFIGVMTKQQPTYKDCVLEEDLYSPGDIREDHPIIPANVSDELEEVTRMMRDLDCGYFRIIYT